MDDASAFMELAKSNSQGELSPLERGMHALGAVKPGKHGHSAEAYAKAIGRENQIRDIRRELAAAIVAAAESAIWPIWSSTVRHLAELHAAPSWLRPALVAELVAKEWTVSSKLRRSPAPRPLTPHPRH